MLLVAVGYFLPRTPLFEMTVNEIIGLWATTFVMFRLECHTGRYRCAEQKVVLSVLVSAFLAAVKRHGDVSARGVIGTEPLQPPLPMPCAR